MENSQVAKVYAKALLEVGQDSKQTEELVSELKDILSILLSNEDIWNFLISPQFSKANKLISLEKALKGSASEQILSFLSILIKNDRIFYLSDIYTQFSALNDKVNNILRVTLQSAAPLSKENLSEITKWFLDEYKMKAEIETVVRPELVGGVVIYFDDKVIDGSIQSNLKNISKSILLHAGEQLISNKNTGAYYEN
jgi:F-type H+-transporting ATPase subunit delta